jgi:hypothetical protein
MEILQHHSKIKHEYKVEDERLKGEEKHTCGGLMEASWGELVAYIVGWQWYGAAYWREFCGTREKQNES